MPKPALTIHDLPRVERPREKLLAYGPQRLSDAELLALILRTGRRGENALRLAGKICGRWDNQALPAMTAGELRTVPGIGLSKACAVLACIELGSRIFSGKKTQITQLLSPGDVFDALSDIRLSKKEHFVVVFLDTRNQQIKREIISIGTINASLVHPREVFEPAVKHLAVQIILAHNHPSGDLQPSEEDLSVNRRLAQAGEILGIEVVDHIIVTKDGHFSFKEHGFM